MAGRKHRSGRRKLPDNVKKFTGTYRPDRENKNQPKPKGRADCPSFLGAAAKREWERLDEEMRRLNLLTTIDRATFAVYAQAWADWKWSVGVLRIAKNRLYTTPTGQRRRHPAWDIKEKSEATILRISIEFGMTPSARSRIDSILPTGGSGSGSPQSPGGGDGDDEPVLDRHGRPV